MRKKQIRFGGRWSGDDLGVEITAGGFSEPQPRILREKVAGMDGSYDFSRMDGSLHYDDREGYYTFHITGRTPGEAADKKSALLDWIYSGSTELYDENIDGYMYVGVSCTGIDEPKIIGTARREIEVTVHFTAAPYMRSISGRLTDCMDFTPNSDPTTYLFAAHMSDFKMVRLKGLGTSGYTDLSISFATVSPQSGIHYAVAEIPQSSAPKWYLMPKKIGGMDITMEEPEGCVCIREDADYYYLYQQTTTAVSVQIWGLDYDTYTEVQLESMIRHADWLLTDDVEGFPQNSVPSTRDMRIISEGTPTLTVNGVTADTAGFPLSVGDLLTVGNAQNEPCRLQYCTIRERR